MNKITAQINLIFRVFKITDFEQTLLNDQNKVRKFKTRSQCHQVKLKADLLQRVRTISGRKKNKYWHPKKNSNRGCSADSGPAGTGEPLLVASGSCSLEVKEVVADRCTTG